MTAIERLKRDHEILHTKLNVLESAVHMGPETWFVLREVCFTLARQLRDHMRREEALIAACRNALDPVVLAQIHLEHQDEPQHLRTINRLFLQEHGHLLEHIRPDLTTLIAGLRHHMDEEEQTLFPAIERVLCSKDLAAIGTTVPVERLHEAMTVNRIVQEYPHTQRVFEQFFINIPLEGCQCLDEVAWRHGMESRELMDHLERELQLIPEHREPEPAELWSPTGKPVAPC